MMRAHSHFAAIVLAALALWPALAQEAGAQAASVDIGASPELLRRPANPNKSPGLALFPAHGAVSAHAAGKQMSAPNGGTTRNSIGVAVTVRNNPATPNFAGARVGARIAGPAVAPASPPSQNRVGLVHSNPNPGVAAPLASRSTISGIGVAHASTAQTSIGGRSVKSSGINGSAIRPKR
jgi:hypothetical protein